MIGGQKMFGSVMKLSHKPEKNHPPDKKNVATRAQGTVAQVNRGDN